MFELFEILSIKRAYWGANKIHSLCSALQWLRSFTYGNIVLWVFCCVFRFTLTSIMDFDINLDRISQKCLGCDPVVTRDAVFVLRVFGCFGEVSSCSLINQHTMKCQQNGAVHLFSTMYTIPTNAITKCHIHPYRSWICWNHHFEWLSGFNMHETPWNETPISVSFFLISLVKIMYWQLTPISNFPMWQRMTAF